MSALWEDLTVILCKEEDLQDLPSENVFATISTNREDATWLVSENLEPLANLPPNPKAISEESFRILFSNHYSPRGYSDLELVEFLLGLKKTKNGEAVLSTMDYASPVGFLNDFLLSFFSMREIFFATSSDLSWIQSCFNSYEIDHLVCETSQVEFYQNLKRSSQRNKAFQSIVSFPSG